MASLIQYKNKNGSISWRIIATNGFDKSTGKYHRITETFKGSKKDAQLKAKEIQLKVDQGQYSKSSNDTVASIGEQWLERKKMEQSLRTYDYYVRTFNPYIKKYIGNVKIKDLNPLAVEKFLHKVQNLKSKRTNKKLSGTSLHHIFKTLKNMLNYAVILEVIDKNPMENLKAPKKTSQEFQIPTSLEVKNILEYMGRKTHLMKKINNYYYSPKWVYVGTAVASQTGMRLGEVLGLKWSDIDMKKNTISIQRSIVNTDSGSYVGNTKNPKQRRTINIPNSLSNILKEYEEYMKEQMEYFYDERDLTKEDYLFPYINGHNGDYDFDKTYLPSSLSQAWKRVNRILGYDYKFHSLRHFVAVTLMERNINLKKIQLQLGHSSIDITADIYGRYVKPENDQEITNVLDNMFN